MDCDSTRCCDRPNAYCAPPSTRDPCGWRRKNVTLHLNDGDQTLTNLSVRLQHDPDGAQLTLSFGMAGSQSGKASSPASIDVSLAAGADSNTPYVVRFDTGGASLPCSLIGSYWPAAGRLGPASTFDGRVTATRNAGLWTLELNGRLREVDLERLLEPYPHKLNGTAEIVLEHATIVNGQLVSAAGKLVAGPGVISRSLIHAAEQHLGVEPSRQTMLGRDNHIEYRELNLAFKIDQAGLVLRGEFPKAPGAILVDEKVVLVRQGADKPLPVVNLLRTLVPQSAVHVPATRETNPLAAFLPVPAVRSPAGQEEQLPQARAITVRPR